MLVTNEDLRPVLAQILFGKDYEKHLALVVPKQGNFLDPRTVQDTDSFFTYYISSVEKQTLNPTAMYAQHTSNVLLTVRLQGVGIGAERLMLTTLFWDERDDVRKLFETVNCVLLDSKRTIISAPYFQEGVNTLLAFETVLKLSCALTIEETLSPMPELILSGSVDY